MIRNIDTANGSGHKFAIVRRGYDPYDVQRLVSKLASELKAVAAENDALRAGANGSSVRPRNADGEFVERRSQERATAGTKVNPELRENLRCVRSALDDLLGHLAGAPRTANLQHQDSQR